MSRTSCCAILHDITPNALFLNGKILVFMAERAPKGRSTGKKFPSFHICWILFEVIALKGLAGKVKGHVQWKPYSSTETLEMLQQKLRTKCSGDRCRRALGLC